MYRIVKQLKENEKLELDNLERCVLNNAYFSVSPYNLLIKSSILSINLA